VHGSTGCCIKPLVKWANANFDPSQRSNRSAGFDETCEGSHDATSAGSGGDWFDDVGGNPLAAGAEVPPTLNPPMPSVVCVVLLVCARLVVADISVGNHIQVGETIVEAPTLATSTSSSGRLVETSKLA